MLTIVKYPGDCHVILDIKIVNDIKIMLVANQAISCMMQCLSIIGGYSNWDMCYLDSIQFTKFALTQDPHCISICLGFILSSSLVGEVYYVIKDLECHWEDVTLGLYLWDGAAWHTLLFTLSYKSFIEWVGLCVLPVTSMCNLTHGSMQVECWYLWIDTQMSEVIHVAIILDVSAISTHVRWLNADFWAMHEGFAMAFLEICLLLCLHWFIWVSCVDYWSVSSEVDIVDSHTAYGFKFHQFVDDGIGFFPVDTPQWKFVWPCLIT